MNPVVAAALAGAIASVAVAVIGGLLQQNKVKAEVDLTAAETAAIVLKELRAEREDLRLQVQRLEHEATVDREHNRQAINEMRALEAKCQERLARAIQVMRANGLDVPADLDVEISNEPPRSVE